MTGYKIIGVMSGTSLDGLDIALCDFRKNEHSWNYKIIKAKTFKYTDSWKKKLEGACTLNSHDFIMLHNEYGDFIGNKIKTFLSGHSIMPDLISSHGHTIFHEPNNGLTFQIGNGANITAATGITTISDFRSLDIALKGQGAPLVPAGDDLLFGDYDYCLNLGGFCNISYRKNKKRIAFDICPVNIILNRLSGAYNMEYDKDGKLGRDGCVNKKLLKELDDISFYKQDPPKSISREWLEQVFVPVLKKHKISDKDKISTIYEHISYQIAKIPAGNSKTTLFVTGGGVYNKYLMDLLGQISNCSIIIPDKIIIEYKEAMIFAFLGMLRIRNEINCLSSATGAKFDNIGGTIFRINR